MNNLADKMLEGIFATPPAPKKNRVNVSITNIVNIVIDQSWIKLKANY